MRRFELDEADAPGPDMPDVSVVVIVYNDAANLPRAVTSALGQTLRNLEVVIVDDASTDDTPLVAERLVTQHPGRVRVVRLPENSGGCSRPRNRGIEAARGRYLMFLDSDDELDRHACKTMLVTAETNDVDVVTGQVKRVHADSGETTGWFVHLYRRSGVYHSARDFPALFDDMLSTNKCYRRDFLLESGIRFPEGLLYEDSLFTTQIYLNASGVAVVPHIVYHWHVRASAPVRSITRRRHEFKNFSDRIVINRMIDRLLDEHGSTDIRRTKDSRFLRHDLRLYLNDLHWRDDAYRLAFLNMAAEYLDEIDPTIFDELNPVLRIAMFMVRKRDLEGVLSAMNYLNFDGKVTTRLVIRDGRVYWCDRYLDTEEGRRVLDVTQLGLHTAQLPKLHFYNRITQLRVEGSDLYIEAVIINQLDRIPAEGFALDLTVKERHADKRSWQTFPVEVIAHEGNQIRWRGVIPLARLITGLGLRDCVYVPRLRLRIGGASNLSTLTAERNTQKSIVIPVRAPSRAFGGDYVRASVSSTGELVLRLRTVNPLARARRFAARAVLRTERKLRLRGGLGRALGTVRRFADDPELKRLTYARILVRLPIRKGSIVFESHLGKQYSDNPRRIYEEIKARGLPYRCAWGYASSPRGFPDDAQLFRRNTWRYLIALARAQYWVDNAGLPPSAVKRPGQTYIQTWHGTALKVMGFDVPNIKAGSKQRFDALAEQSSRWDAFVVRCEHDVETLVPAFRFKGEVLRYGYPRNDVLSQPLSIERRAEVLERLGLPKDRKLVLYAPTFRTARRGNRAGFSMRIDLEDWAARLGEDHLLMVRPHYLSRFVLPHRHADQVRNVAGVHDVSELLTVTDILVTDYSSIMFDFAVTRRPMIFFTYDYADYTRQTRGTYFDLAELAPGPLVSTSAQLIDALESVDSWQCDFSERYEVFAKRFAAYDDGHATERIVDRFFASGNGRGHGDGRA